MRKAVFATASLVCAVALAGCGESDTDATASMFDDPQRLAAAASSETAQSQSENFTLEADLPGREITAEGAGSFDGAESALSMTADMAGRQMQLRMVDQTVYMTQPTRDSANADATSWVQIPLDEAHSSSHQGQLGQNGQIDQLLEQHDPQRILESIAQSGSITGSERARLDGESVTHYTIELDLGEFAQHGPVEMPPEARQALPETEPVPLQLWVNDDNLPVKVVVDASSMVQVAADAAGHSVPEGEATITMRYTDWGTQVDVQPPPEDQIEELHSRPNAPPGDGLG